MKIDRKSIKIQMEKNNEDYNNMKNKNHEIYEKLKILKNPEQETKVQ